MWDPSTAPNLAGYVLHYGTEPGVPTDSVDVGNVTSHAVTVTIGQTYYFVVTAYATDGSSSGASAMASGGVFTDRPLTVGVTSVKATHLTELRSRINATRVVRGLADYSWVEPITPSTVIKAQHVAEMRVALAAAFAVEPALSTPSYTDSPLDPGTVVKAIHFTQLRAYVEQLEATP